MMDSDFLGGSPDQMTSDKGFVHMILLGGSCRIRMASIVAGVNASLFLLSKLSLTSLSPSTLLERNSVNGLILIALHISSIDRLLAR